MRRQLLVGMLVLVAMALAPIGGSSAGTKPEFGYITNQMSLPLTSQEANAYGRDMDRDGNKDNQFGHVLSAMMQAGGLDLAAATQDAVTTGDIVMLHSLRTFSISNTKNATWQVWYGAPTDSPDFSGAGVFPLPPLQPHSAKLDATIKNHVVKTVSGKIPVRIDFGAGPFTLWLKRGKVVTTCFRAGCVTGRVNGAVSAHDIDDMLIPELAQWITAVITAGTCALVGDPASVQCEDSTAAALEALFNTMDTETGDEDLVVTPDELRSNDLLESTLAMDLDLVSGDGGSKDHLSFGFGFTTVKAKLTRP